MRSDARHGEGFAIYAFCLRYKSAVTSAALIYSVYLRLIAISEHRVAALSRPEWIWLRAASCVNLSLSES